MSNGRFEDNNKNLQKEVKDTTNKPVNQIKEHRNQSLEIECFRTEYF
ncbi:MAG: hypothetical protein WB975_13420 [Nitrososphaeraceae archaeon]